MGRLPEDPRLAQWAKAIEDLGWGAFILDSDFNFAWTSSEMIQFLGSPTEEELGYGGHAIEAFTREAWLRTITPDTQAKLFLELVPYLFPDLPEKRVALSRALPPNLAPLLEQIQPKPTPAVWSTSFDYVAPDQGPDVQPFRVDLLLTVIHDEQDDRVGVMGLTYMGVRPTLVSLLAQGEQEMYQRMARLVEPRARRAAILFCDLQGSAELSRKLPTAAYFRLIRRLWTDIDKTVASNYGIVGKHAGDGASAFFLVEDLGSPSAAAAAAIETARTIHERAEVVSKDVLSSPCVMRVGLHWGDTIYLGQLVPGGRLDIAALGDAVNECARVEECATSGTTLATKELIERLNPDDAAATGVDLDRISYRLVSELAAVPEKAKRDIGSLAIAEV